MFRLIEGEGYFRLAKRLALFSVGAGEPLKSFLLMKDYKMIYNCSIILELCIFSNHEIITRIKELCWIKWLLLLSTNRSCPL